MEIHIAFTLVAAFILDLILGDPLWLFHPVYRRLILETLLIYYCISPSSLGKAAMEVDHAPFVCCCFNPARILFVIGLL